MSSSNDEIQDPPSPTFKKRKREESATAVDASSSEIEPDGPMLSHAERRKQKKAAKSAQQKESAPKKKKLKDGTTIPLPASKRQNSVWVGNLSFKTTQEDLRSFFQSAGEILRINMPTKVATRPRMQPENRGFAYVDFATPEAKAAAVALSEQPLIGRKLLIKDGDDFTGRPPVPGIDSLTGGAGNSTTHSKSAQKILRTQKQPPAPTLFLGNLGFETSEQDIRQLFEAHHVVKKKAKDESGVKKVDDSNNDKQDILIRKVRMSTFEDSGACKGFAFIDFTSIELATTALINPKNHQLNGRKLVVEYASPDAVRRGAPKDRRREGHSQPKKEIFPNAKPERPEGHQRRHDSTQYNDKPNQHVGPVTADVDVQLPRTEAPIRISSSSHRTEKREKGPRVRPKPGAALAMAKRESASIVPSTGQKITF